MSVKKSIAIIGSGNVGGALALGWARAGHRIYLGVRDVQQFKGRHLLEQRNISAELIATAAAHAEIIVLAAVPEATIAIVEALGNVEGKLIIDAMNSIRTKPPGYADTFSALVDLASGAQIIKCFNSTGAENMLNPQYGEQLIDMFMAGDSMQAKAMVRQLALDLGFAECYDFGGRDRVPLLEQLALAWINLAIFQGNGRSFAFKVLKR